LSSQPVGRLLDRVEEYGVECYIRQVLVTDTNAQALLLERLRHAGIVDVLAVEPATSGLAATAGIARRGDGSCVFVKTFGGPSSDGVFVAEADVGSYQAPTAARPLRPRKCHEFVTGTW
jgi:hypothetical protein